MYLEKCKKKKIFLLEDNPIHRELIVDGLEDVGYEVRKAPNSTAAEEILKDFTPELFILDIVIESIKGGGIHFSQKIRENPKLKTIPILFISAHLDALNREKYFPEGSMEHILPKPFDFEQLLNKVRELLRH